VSSIGSSHDYVQKSLVSSQKRKHDSEEVGDKSYATNVFDADTASFVLVIDGCSKDINNAANFQTKMVKHINPKAGIIEKMFPFPISQHCETNHEGTKKVFEDVGQAFQMFAVNENGTTKLLPNAKRRKINLHVDGLTAQNFRKLRYNMTRKLTELGASKYIKPMIEALDQITCQHDIFCETRMHRNDCIWRSKYSCFLSALQVLLGWKRINGDPVQSRMQEHELFLFIVEKAL